MIEEFEEWLIRKHGVCESLASDMHDAVYKEDEQGLIKLGIPGEFDSDEMIGLYHQWQREVGER